MKEITIIDFEENFDEVFDEVSSMGEHFVIIDEEGHPIAVMVPHDEYVSN